MPDMNNFTPQHKVLGDDELARLITIITLAQQPSRGAHPQTVEYEYLKAKQAIGDYRGYRYDPSEN